MPKLLKISAAKRDRRHQHDGNFSAFVSRSSYPPREPVRNLLGGGQFDDLPPFNPETNTQAAKGLITVSSDTSMGRNCA